VRIMGLDVGEKRIGIAFSDPMGWTAQGHSVLERKEKQQDLEYLQKMCQEYEVERIVVGFPRNMDGSIGAKAIEVEEFARNIKEITGLSVDFWDERLSTRSAERTLLEADISRRKRKNVIDKLAAVNILQAYLERMGNSSS